MVSTGGTLMPNITVPIARLAGVIKSYGRLTALDGADLQIRRGELLALLGPNGAGKTTAIALLLGLIRADSGKVDAKLSGSQQRSVQFALALCGRPELLFLDEPTVGLDIEIRQKLWAAIRQLIAEGCSVLLTTHYLEEAEALADRVCVMAHGRMIHEGTVEALRSRVSLKRIRCISALDVELVRSWQHVTDVRRDSERLHITTTEAETVVRRLLDADAQLSELEVQRAGLAEAFTELTRNADQSSTTTQREAA
jgi:ABC-2 type transport system ATP-binding protein